ncbi:MAG: phosphoenolpyruvate--protein phosphotransferase [Ruminococcus sp.]|nr:phosphoenolpyruvate--protein phosphotransferase [Ruminococcus sp.]
MLKGIGVSKGYGIGKTIIIQEKSLEFTPKTDCNPEVELNRYHEAVDTFCKNTTAMAEKIKVSIGEKEAEILNGHILMIKDPYMNSEIEKLINNGQCAESSLTAICDMFAMVFSSSDDELTKQRATDVNDIKDGILSILLGIKEIDISCVPPNTVLVAKDLTPSMTACINKENIVGIVTEIGGKTSHSAILARAMEIPAVLSVPNVASILHDDDLVIVDGNNGTIIQNPTSEQVDDYTKKRVDFIEERKALSKYIGKETITQDGIKVELVGNIGNPENANSVVEFDGEGIGLFRTEFLFMDRNSAPTEEEQFDAYKKVALIMKGKPVIIRTLDIGGDKDIPYLNMKKEDNPFLGFRAIRYCLQNKELYRLQLKALVRASAFGDIRIMIPLVTCIDELRQVKTMIKGIMAELDVENISYNKDLKVGVMIETPSACLIADILAKESDFFSIGTNDLTQYTMAVDRGNPDVAYLYSAYNLAVIRSIKHIIDCAKTENIPVGMCGETASDSLMIPILLSFGLDEFSVSPTSILATRKEISKWTKEKADNITQLVMQQTTEKDILEILKQSME